MAEESGAGSPAFQDASRGSAASELNVRILASSSSNLQSTDIAALAPGVRLTWQRFVFECVVSSDAERSSNTESGAGSPALQDASRGSFTCLPHPRPVCSHMPR